MAAAHRSAPQRRRPLDFHSPRRNFIFPKIMKTKPPSFAPESRRLHPHRTARRHRHHRHSRGDAAAGAGSGQADALKTKAHLEAVDIATAIQGYDSAYGRFPVSGAVQAAAGTGDFTYGGTLQNEPTPARCKSEPKCRRSATPF
jgi:hypothetical protein